MLHPSGGMSTPPIHLRLCFRLMLESKNCYSIAENGRTSPKLYSYQSFPPLVVFPLLARWHTIKCPSHSVFMLTVADSSFIGFKEFKLVCCKCSDVMSVNEGTCGIAKCIPREASNTLSELSFATLYSLRFYLPPISSL